MLAPTHSVFGIFLTLTALAVFGVEWGLHWTIILCSIVGAIIPDIDHPNSTVGKLFPFISIPLERKYGHRTITHSLFGWLVSGLLFSLLVLLAYCLLIFVCNLELVAWDLVIRWLAAFSLSYFSHLVLDMFNPRGSQMLWPQPVRDVIPKSAKFRPRSGAKVELLIFFLLLVLMVLALPISKYGLGSSLHWLLATPSAAIEEVKYLKTRAYVEFKGVMSETREPIEGKAEILDVQDKRLVILLKDNGRRTSDLPADRQGVGQVYTLSDGLNADILAASARVKKTAIPIIVKHYEFLAAGRGELLAQIPQGALISGLVHLPEGLEIKLPVKEGDFKIMEQKGRDLVLTFVAKEQLARLTAATNFELQNKMDRAELGKLNAQTRVILSRINELAAADDLTPLGKQLLTAKQDQLKQDAQLAELSSRLEEVRARVNELRSKISDRKLLFSGEVIIRQ